MPVKGQRADRTLPATLAVSAPAAAVEAALRSQGSNHFLPLPRSSLPHGSLVPTPRRHPIGFGTDMFEATAEGNWTTTEDRRVWVVGQDGMTFGSGWHSGHDETSDGAEGPVLGGGIRCVPWRSPAQRSEEWQDAVFRTRIRVRRSGLRQLGHRHDLRQRRKHLAGVPMRCGGGLLHGRHQSVDPQQAYFAGNKSTQGTKATVVIESPGTICMVALCLPATPIPASKPRKEGFVVSTRRLVAVLSMRLAAAVVAAFPAVRSPA